MKNEHSININVILIIYNTRLSKLHFENVRERSLFIIVRERSQTFTIVRNRSQSFLVGYFYLVNFSKVEL